MNTAQKAMVGAAIVGSVIAGGASGAAITGGASAETSAPNDSATAAPSDGATDPGRPPFDPAKGGHVGANGVAEELLTGDTATRVTDAVKAKYPDATIERVETDAEGAAYEAHIVQADGTHATVKLDESYAITGTETGGPGRR